MCHSKGMNAPRKRSTLRRPARQIPESANKFKLKTERATRPALFLHLLLLLLLLLLRTQALDLPEESIGRNHLAILLKVDNCVVEGLVKVAQVDLAPPMRPLALGALPFLFFRSKRESTTGAATTDTSWSA